jgi:peptidoglycan/xylan/chitin deacetylase (PgdA/CDA1 family)
MLSPLLNWLSPAGPQARLSVLIFHRVMPAPDALFPDEMHARRFDEVCGWIKSWFNVLPLDQAVARMAGASLPARAACITFDDGYADNFHVALPILQRHGLSATFFIATDFLDGGCMWNDSVVESVRHAKCATLDLSCLGLGCHATGSLGEKRRTIAHLIPQLKYLPAAHRILATAQIAQLAKARSPRDLMMRSAELVALHRAGMQIGAHTESHPILALLDAEQTRREIQGSQHFLERLLGERVGLFAYPNGKPGEDYTPLTVDVVRSLDFDAAVSTAWGTNGAGDDVFQIRRFTPWDKSRLRFGARMVGNFV